MVDNSTKETLKTLQRMDKHLADISKSLSTMVKIVNRQVPAPEPVDRLGYNSLKIAEKHELLDEEDEDYEMP